MYAFSCEVSNLTTNEDYHYGKGKRVNIPNSHTKCDDWQTRKFSVSKNLQIINGLLCLTQT